jgi:hypothetical protein
VTRDLSVVRLRALLAPARGDETTYQYLVRDYRAMAESLGYEGHMARAEGMQ